MFVLLFGVPDKTNDVITKRLSSASRAKSYRRELSEFIWSEIYESEDPNFQYSFLINAIKGIYDKHFPLKGVKVNHKTRKNPWITLGILKSIKRKNKLYKIRYKVRNPSPQNDGKFRAYRNRLNHLIRFTKIQYYTSLLENTKGNLRATWNVINEIFK